MVKTQNKEGLPYSSGFVRGKAPPMFKPYHLFKYHPREDDDFTIIAHRGASAYYPENTLPAFDGAIVMGADMVEFDVQLTADREVVVFHDKTVSRCTDGKGNLSHYTLASLKKLDAGIRFDKSFKKTTIPTLAEALDICKNRIAANIEIKTEAVSDIVAGGIEEKCLKIIECHGMRGHVVFSSFDPRAIMHLKQIDNAVAVAVLFEKKLYGSRLPSEVLELVNADAFNCSADRFNKKWLEDIRPKHIPVNIYTVNDEKKMKRFLDMGVNGIFTNKPDVLKKVLADVKKRKADDRRQ